MRTRTRVCLLALCAALLTGCGGRTVGAKAYDPAAAAQALLDAKVFDQELEVLDADLAGSYLGLSSEPEEAVVYTSLEGGYEELAVLRMADAEAAAAALEAVQAHVSDRREREAETQYKPEDLPKLEKALTEQAGNTVLLVVCADYDAAQKALDALGS